MTSLSLWVTSGQRHYVNIGAVSPQNFICRNRLWVRCGTWAMVCQCPVQGLACLHGAGQGREGHWRDKKILRFCRPGQAVFFPRYPGPSGASGKLLGNYCSHVMTIITKEEEKEDKEKEGDLHHMFSWTAEAGCGKLQAAVRERSVGPQSVFISPPIPPGPASWV